MRKLENTKREWNRIAYDCDGVLWDFHTYACTILVNEGLIPSVECLNQHDVHIQFPQTFDRIGEIASDPAVYRALRPFEDGFSLARDLIIAGYDVEFHTARGCHLRDMTYVGLSGYMEQFDIFLSWDQVQTFGSSAKKVENFLANNFDILIEDNPGTHEKLLAAGHPEKGLFVVAQPYNRSYERLPRRSYDEIHRILIEPCQQADTLVLSRSREYLAIPHPEGARVLV